MRLKLGFGLGAARQMRARIWLLASGYWSDNGKWDDTATWNDEV